MSYFFQTWNDSITLLEEENLTFPSHLHKTAELVFVQEGSISITVSDKNYLLHQDNLLAIFPGQLHEYSSQNTANKIHIIMFDSHSFPEYIQCFEQFHPSNPLIPNYLLHEDAFLALERLYSPSTPSSVKSAWLNLLLAHTIPSLHLKRNTTTIEPHLVSRILEYLSIHFAEPVTLDLLAREMHVNKFYLSHTFTDKLHISFTEYLNRLRIEKAQKLLTTTNYNIEKIGELSGFETQRTFNRVFKSITGLSPREYRKKNTNPDKNKE